MEGICPSHAESNYVACEQNIFYSERREEQGVSFCCALSVQAEDGTVTGEEDKISVRGCTRAVVRLCAKSNFEGVGVRPCDSQIDCVGSALFALKKAGKKNYDELLRAHRQDFESLFERTEFDIGGREEEIPVDERMKDFSVTGEDAYLIELLFHYGKYLLISGSREGTQAMNLQGIWNESLTPPWRSHYALNINTQMNYWAAEPLNLSECHEPLLRFIEELSVSGEEVAREYYGASGFVTHHCSDLWQHTNPGGRKREGCSVYSFWPISSGWLCRHLYEHYEYTQDETFLKETVYPVLKKACLFYADVLVPWEGELIFCPSTSPENKYIHDDKKACIARSSAMTVSVIRELFSEFGEVCERLGISDAFTERIALLKERVQRVKIGSRGQILEWCEEVREAEPTHRHLSHLYFAYPGDEAFQSEEYKAAVEKSLLLRSNEGTGWSLAWKVCLWGRLGRAEQAEQVLKNQLRLIDVSQSQVSYKSAGGSYPNLFCAHPPFQIDGNLGVCAGILEMLVSCRNKKIYILSALPKSWKNGCLRGVKLKGNLTLSMEWQEGKIQMLNLFSERRVQADLVLNGENRCVELKNGWNKII